MPQDVRRSEPGILIKLGVSAVLGLIVLGVSVPFNKLPNATAYNVALSVFVGGVAFIIQFLWEVERRLERMEDAYTVSAQRTEAHVTDGFRKINQATELFTLVEESALKTDAMTQLVRSSTSVKSSPALLFDFAQAEISRMGEMLSALGTGADATYDGEDRDWMLGLTKVARNTIDATSLTTVDARGQGFVDGGLWASDLGQRYLDDQRDAIRRGVVIRRIFILDRPDLADDPEFVNICAVHGEIGIDVRIVDPSSLPSTRRDSLFDFIIFDNVLSYQATPAARVGDNSRPVILNTRLITRQKAVQDNIDAFHELWRDSKTRLEVSSR